MKKLFRKIHIYLGLFTIPLGLLFASTGLLVIFGFEESYGEKIKTYTVNDVVLPGAEVEFVKSWAEKNNVVLPELTLTEAEELPAVGTASYVITVEVKENKTHLTSYERNLLTSAILLHKGEVKWYFNILTVLFGISLMSFYITGLYVTVYHKTVEGKKVLRKEYIYTIIAGAVITVFVAILSV